MGDSCPHLSLVLKVNKEELLDKSEGSCSACNGRVKLWSCLQGGCQFIGCSASNLDHSTKHYQESKHAIAVNLGSFRIWCFACDLEVHLPSAFTPVEMKNMKRERKRRANATNPTPQKQKLKSEEAAQKPQEPDQANLPSNMEQEANDTQVGIPLGLTGLRNLGNTCYMNSALQAISNCLPLTQYFLNDESFYFIDKKPSMAKNYHKLVRDMWNPMRHSCITPSGIHMTLKSINPSFRGYHQQDAQEFLRCLMDRLHEELKYPVPKWNDHSLNADISAMDQHNDIEALDIEDHEPNGTENQHEPEDIPMNYDDVDSNIQSSSSSMESFHSATSESLNMGSHPAMPGVSAGAPINHMTTSYDNLSDLHGTETPKDQESQSLNREDTSLPTMHKNVQYKRSQSPTRRTRNTEARTKKQIKRPRKSKYRYQSIISEIFDGELRSSVQCLTCDQVSHTRETFQDLSLPIPGKDDLTRLHGTNGYYPASGSTNLPVVPGFKGPCSETRPTAYVMNSVWGAWEWLKSWFWGPQVTLNDCLSAFFSADELKGDNMYSCEKCKKLRNGVKYCRLLQLPEVLCIHLKRFRHEYLMSYSSKISSPVSFPITGLDLRPFLAQDSPSNCTSYDLCSVIVHLGNAGGGHYTTYAKNFTDQKWYEFDDQFVTQVSESTVENAEAYVLFYCKSSVEAGRARDRISNLYQEEQQRLASIDNPSPRSLLQFYVSLKWINKFATFTEPGPIDNSDFVCRHLDISPESYDNLDLSTVHVTERVWQEMHSRFGGGPVMTHPEPCRICTEEYFRLRERCKYEKEMFLKHNRVNRDSESVSSGVYISLEWFREWEDFLNGKLPEPPGEVDNGPICFTKEGKHFLRKNSSHAAISRNAWDFLISLYGGGPLVSVRYRHASSASSPPRMSNVRGTNKTAPARSKESEKSTEEPKKTEVSPETKNEARPNEAAKAPIEEGNSPKETPVGEKEQETEVDEKNTAQGLKM